MSTTQTWFLDQLKNQGPSFLLMGVMLWYLYGKVGILEQEQKQMQVQIQECNRVNQEILINHIQKNSELLQRYEFNHAPETRRRSFPGTEITTE
ncbi:MAG: hypothetical protein C0424_10410 [Sphingobacteriaceae bacterium]|nr:hypothetical protein [Sphingobacteriaceae bacterium]